MLAVRRTVRKSRRRDSDHSGCGDSGQRRQSCAGAELTDLPLSPERILAFVG